MEFRARALGHGSALGEGLQTVGSIFVQLLRALVPPLVFIAIGSFIAALKDLANAARLVAPDFWRMRKRQKRADRHMPDPRSMAAVEHLR
ncbi:MAG: hypothetical protein Q7T68_03400 [Sphingopyxis sp.]|nr:hypothetical protein [Sphingopyxis sp.]